jgi:hypothetical protein
VPGRPDEAVDAAAPDHRPVVGCRRAQSGTCLHELELAHVGQHLPCGLEQPVDAVGGHARVEAALLHGRADHDLPARARHDVAARRADDARCRRRAVQAQDLPLHRTHGRCVRQVEAAAPGAGRDDDGAGAHSASCQVQPNNASVPHLDGVGVCQQNLGTDARERAHHGAGIYGAIRRRNSPAHARRETGFELAAAAAREPLRFEAVRDLELVETAKLREVVAIGRHHQRAALAVGGVESCPLCEPRGEGRPAAGCLEVQSEQRLLPKSRLGDRCKHPGGHARGTGARLRAVDEEHAESAPLGFPRAREPDDPRAHDGDVVAGPLRRVVHCLARLLATVAPSFPTPALPGSGQRSAATQPPSQPRWPELPCVDLILDPASPHA